MHRIGRKWLLACALGFSVAAWGQTPTHPGLVAQDSLNGADTAWMMTSRALVLLMTLPGIALFYGGMVRRKNALNTMASIVAVAALVSLLWFAVGYSIAFTPGSPWLGDGSRLWFSGLNYLKEAGKVAVSHVAPNVPESVYAMFQLTFAIITAALIVGALVERMRFSAMLWFTGMWSIVVYAPVAHWVWEPGGWLATMGVLDFAGGAVVHINAGVSGLVCAYVLGPRKGYGKEPFKPYNLGFTMAGAGLLIDAVAGLACYWGATELKRLLNADDSLDVFGVHGIGGIVGALMNGVLANRTISGVQGDVGIQLLGVVAVLLYSATMSVLLLWVTKVIVGLRVDDASEEAGLDISQHREQMGT